MNPWQTAFTVFGISAVISFLTAGLIKLIVVVLGLGMGKKGKAGQKAS
jgi:hypothetical protein